MPTAISLMEQLSTGQHQHCTHVHTSSSLMFDLTFHKRPSRFFFFFFSIDAPLILSGPLPSLHLPWPSTRHSISGSLIPPYRDFYADSCPLHLLLFAPLSVPRDGVINFSPSSFFPPLPFVRTDEILIESPAGGGNGRKFHRLVFFFYPSFSGNENFVGGL